MYFVGWNDPSWMYSVKTTLKSEDMTEWMDSLTAEAEVVQGSGSPHLLTPTSTEAEQNPGTSAGQTSRGFIIFLYLSAYPKVPYSFSGSGLRLRQQPLRAS